MQTQWLSCAQKGHVEFEVIAQVLDADRGLQSSFQEVHKNCLKRKRLS